MVSKRKRPHEPPKTGHDLRRESPRATPVSDEDPAMFWGADWKDRIERAKAQAEAGDGLFFESDEAFLSWLDARAG